MRLKGWLGRSSGSDPDTAASGSACREDSGSPLADVQPDAQQPRSRSKIERVARGVVNRIWKYSSKAGCSASRASSSPPERREAQIVPVAAPVSAIMVVPDELNCASTKTRVSQLKSQLTAGKSATQLRLSSASVASRSNRSSRSSSKQLCIGEQVNLQHYVFGSMGSGASRVSVISMAYTTEGDLFADSTCPSPVQQCSPAISMDTISPFATARSASKRSTRVDQTRADHRPPMRIDSEVTIPGDLAERLLQTAQKVRRAGQHTLVTEPSSLPSPVSPFSPMRPAAEARSASKLSVRSARMASKQSLVSLASMSVGDDGEGSKEHQQVSPHVPRGSRSNTNSSKKSKRLVLTSLEQNDAP
eukprot:TRINITY_DN111385_c0_g1_i1.p1 TRINITY_DN111385_c0_g1~~TRINITY_DN111385_c0_g1_i1.p1  ORF type:complete len:361 (+),score=32.85 TRINITY_DN111385_c0_g1_i1:164-1246(+)